MRTNDRFTLKTSALIFGGQPIRPRTLMGNERRHKMLRSGPATPQHVAVMAGEEGFEPSIS
jgi:hypothetical protein